MFRKKSQLNTSSIYRSSYRSVQWIPRKLRHDSTIISYAYTSNLQFHPKNQHTTTALIPIRKMLTRGIIIVSLHPCIPIPYTFKASLIQILPRARTKKTLAGTTPHEAISATSSSSLFRSSIVRGPNQFSELLLQHARARESVLRSSLSPKVREHRIRRTGQSSPGGAKGTGSFSLSWRRRDARARALLKSNRRTASSLWSTGWFYIRERTFVIPGLFGLTLIWFLFFFNFFNIHVFLRSCTCIIIFIPGVHRI